ncbi:cupin, partial [Micromonospora sp. ATA51]|nr:cupin [Micromonospora sp. ATA51]
AGGRPAPIRPLAQAAALATMDADSRVAPRAGLRWQLTPTGDGKVALRLFDRTITLPGTCEPALRAVLAGEVTRVGDLPGLDDDADRIVLARRLLKESVLTPA